MDWQNVPLNQQALALQLAQSSDPVRSAGLLNDLSTIELPTSFCLLFSFKKADLVSGGLEVAISFTVLVQSN